MVRETGVHSLEQFVLAKYYLTTQVYRHRVRLITDSMLTRSIAVGIRVDELEELARLFSYDASAEFIENYIRWDDARFLQEFSGEKYRGKLCHDLVRRLRERKLFKRVFARDLNDRIFPEAQVRNGLMGLMEDDLVRGLVERLIAEVLSVKWGRDVDPSYVILNVHSIKSVREQSRNGERPILVDDRPGPVPFEERSVLFRSIDEAQDECFVEVYAPACYETEAEKRRMLSGLDTQISEVLTSALVQEEKQDENA